MRSQRFVMLVRSAIVAGVGLAGVPGTAGTVMAQALKDVQAADTPLVLKAQGSFFVGGEKVEQAQGELGDLGPGGHITVNQMYVRYMVPQGGDGNVPVVMVHGATLTGKSWETTPDGRMGWDEYFVRKGHPVYVPDQVGRGRSGFNQAVFNNVRAGSAPGNSLPRWIRFSDEVVWPNFRIGAKPGAPYPDTQFPVTALDELSKQGVPDVSFGGVPNPNPTLKALSDLASQVNGAVLMGHSQSGAFPLAAALLESAAAKGLVLVEPGGCPRHVHRRTDQNAGDDPRAGRVRRSPRYADRNRDPALVAAVVRGLSGTHRAPQGCGRPGGDARSGGPRHQRQQPHDHAGQEPPAGR